jgi:DNA-binding HxlR family transcriptional regulator
MFLVIREAFFGVRRFQDFHTELNISRGVLADRLAWLTSHGIFTRTEYQGSPKRFEYRLTQKGLELYPSFIALMKWGDRWLWRGKSPPLALFHKECSCWTNPLTVCSYCREIIAPEAVAYRDGPGAGSTSIGERRRVRRVSDPDTFLRGRRCSVARTLKIMGDRWSFLVIREAFFGVRRYDDFCRNLRISTNILAERLQWMVAEGIFFRSPYKSHREQLEYRFTEKGKQLYASMIAMMRWGDRWLSSAGPPLLLHHNSCGHDFHAIVMCDHCGKELSATQMAYQSRDVRSTTPLEAPAPALEPSIAK